MKFYIVTPSFNQLDFLKRCVASVADQATEGVGAGNDLTPKTKNQKPEHAISVHHHIQDGGSTDGTRKWLERYAQEVRDRSSDTGAPNARTPMPKASLSGYTFSYESAPDKGMYNAINRGWNKAPDDADLIAWLNCDEQYLSGTLEYVDQVFHRNQNLDFVFGDYLMVNEAGKLICYRKAHKPSWPFIISDHLYTLTCTMFLRKRIFDEGLHLDESFHAVGDADFVVRALRSGARTKHCSRYFSSFMVAGGNISLGQEALREKDDLTERAPWAVRKGAKFLKMIRLIIKATSGCYIEKSPLVYEIYENGDDAGRMRFQCDDPQWKATPFLGIK